MKAPTESPSTIDEYIDGCAPTLRARLRELRATIRRAAPGATERIAYRIPTFHLDGNLVHFAAFERHIGFYPAPSGIAAFRESLAGYASAKGSVRFPHDEPLPLDLVAEIVRFRVAENTGKARKRNGGRKA